jgi:hypothetical protein
MSTLAELRDLVERDLDDTGNAVWGTEDIERAIERAVEDYSQVNPQESVDTVELSADGREIDISSVTDLLRLVRVWCPYTAADPEDPPEWREWQLWGTTLTILDGDEPADGDVVRLFYHAAHEVEDLNGASATTVPAADESVIVAGAGAYAALQMGRSAVGQAGVSTETPEHWLKWAMGRLDDFNERLGAIRKRELRKVDKRVPVDREGWDRGSSYRDGI